MTHFTGDEQAPKSTNDYVFLYSLMAFEVQMSLSKKNRKVVWDKSGGKCWYCGHDLPEKGWHADHFWPVLRICEFVRNPPGSKFSHRIASTGEMQRDHNDTLENLVPSCAPCNNYKSSFPIEFFRSELELQIDRARKGSANFRNAERFGLVSVSQVKVVFWFEKMGLKMPDKIDNKAA